ncbi:MAG: hypothetical protein LQ343_008024 [Gyalolechia ehrenbergii]|nr:MAG: hypothetical protein LQ343_008024 [Gyalolechia ehrenbergii]
MAPPPARSLGDVVRELKGILRLRKKLAQSPQQQHLFESSWLDGLLRANFAKLEDSDTIETSADGLEILAKMLDIHQDLSERGFMDLVNQLTAAIIRQKSCLASQGSNAEGQSKDGKKEVKEPVMSGAMPTPSFKNSTDLHP